MSPDLDRFNDDYDPEPDYDRPTRAEAEAEETEVIATNPAHPGVELRMPWKQESDEDEGDTYDGRFCPVCGADLIGNDPHAPDCPADHPDDDEGF